MTNEEWKTFDYQGKKYEVSNYGKVKTFYLNEEGRLMTPQIDRLGYVTISLSSNARSKKFRIHRLVAMLFVPNPYGYNEINHIDGNKQNNYYENLEWCTHQHNMRHAFDTGLDSVAKGILNPCSKPFFQFDLEGNVIQHWNCVRECAEYLFEHDERAKREFSSVTSLAVNISHTLNRKHQTCCGYNFGFDIKAPNIIYEVREKPVVAIDKKTGEKIYFAGVKKTEGYTMPNGKKAIATIVSKCCKGKRNSHAGYTWKYQKHIKNKK